MVFEKHVAVTKEAITLAYEESLIDSYRKKLVRTTKCDLN